MLLFAYRFRISYSTVRQRIPWWPAAANEWPAVADEWPAAADEWPATPEEITSHRKLN